MGDLLPLPRVGDVFHDARDGERTMRVSYHADRNLAVLSIWSGGTCRASFQVTRDELPRLALLLAASATEKPEPGAAPVAHTA